MLFDVSDFLLPHFVDILDILMVGTIIYLIYHWIRGTAAMNIFFAILILLIMNLIAGTLGMTMMSALMNTIVNVGVIALIIIFQPEIRHFLMRLGSNYGLTDSFKSLIDRVAGSSGKSLGNKTVNEIAEACRSMSAEKTGALIVIPRKIPINDIIETGDKIDAIVSRRLLMNLFFKNSPLHDGAIVIKEDKIAAARCTLPITERTDIPARYGMRHKAAIGVSEVSDADVIVVSEETGQISYVNKGGITPINNINELKLLIGNALEEEDAEKTK